MGLWPGCPTWACCLHVTFACRPACLCCWSACMCRLPAVLPDCLPVLSPCVYLRMHACFPVRVVPCPSVRSCCSLGRPGTPVSLGGCPDLGQVRSVVRAFAWRSGLFQCGSSLLSHRPPRFIQGRARRSRRVLYIYIPGSLAHFSRVCSCFPDSSLLGPGIACFSLGRPGPR